MTERDSSAMKKLHDELTSYQESIKNACYKLKTVAEGSRGGMKDDNSKKAIASVIELAETLLVGLPATEALQASLKKQIALVGEIDNLNF